MQSTQSQRGIDRQVPVIRSSATTTTGSGKLANIDRGIGEHRESKRGRFGASSSHSLYKVHRELLERKDEVRQMKKRQKLLY
jgi:hypothetical protein